MSSPPSKPSINLINSTYKIYSKSNHFHYPNYHLSLEQTTTVCCRHCTNILLIEPSACVVTHCSPFSHSHPLASYPLSPPLPCPSQTLWSTETFLGNQTETKSYPLVTFLLLLASLLRSWDLGVPKDSLSLPFLQYLQLFQQFFTTDGFLTLGYLWMLSSRFSLVCPWFP